MLHTRNSLDPNESTNIYIYIYISFLTKLDAISIPFTSLHFPLEPLEVLFGWSNHPRKVKAQAKASTHQRTQIQATLTLAQTQTKDSSTANCWYVPGTQKGPVGKKTHKLNPTSKVIHLRLQNAEASRNVAVLLVRWWCTSYILDNPTCLEPSSHWATHSFETGHCYCWSKSKECPTNINTRWRHVAILWTRHPQGLKNLLNLKSHCPYQQIIPNTLFIVHIILSNETTWNKSLSAHAIPTRHAVFSHLKNRIS